jgi:hypothetical protein
LQLSKQTIDDFYADPQLSFAKQIFSEQTKLKTDEEFEKFLTEKFPETIAETLRFPLEQSILDFKEQIADIEKKIIASQTRIDKLETQVIEKKEQQANIPKKQSKKKSELLEIESEIKLIKPLAGKPPYDKQVEALEMTKEKITKELDSYTVAISKSKEELEELQNKIKTEKETIFEKQSEIKSIHSQFNNKQQELYQLQEKENTHFKNEYSALEFLFKTILHKTINKVEIVTLKETGEKYPFERYNFNEENIERNGEHHLQIRDCGFDEVGKFILPFTNSKCSIPKGWRNIIYKTLSSPIADIAGKISKIKHDSKVYFTSENLKLTHIDTSTLLATKIAAKTKYSLRKADNTIFLGLSGGLSATISFREKGNIISKFQKQPIEIYANCLSSEQFIQQTLYYQTGYANSSIEVKTPGGYYILTDKFVIEIEYVPAPILFDNNSMIQIAPNISSKAKHEDEVAEELRRKSEEDAYLDDYIDDDDDY